MHPRAMACPTSSAIGERYPMLILYGMTLYADGHGMLSGKQAATAHWAGGCTVPEGGIQEGLSG